MQQHAKETGEYLMEGLRKLMDEYPIISDIARSWLVHRRRNGENRNTLAPALPEIDIVVEKVKASGYLLSTDGPLHNVLKIKPPMPFNKQNAGELLSYLRKALDEL